MAEIEDTGTFPEQYWACPLCIITLMVAHGQGTVDNQRAYEALENSGLVEPWPGREGYVTTTEKGKKFIDMIMATPLPVNEWVDPRKDGLNGR